jgi:lysozyme
MKRTSKNGIDLIKSFEGFRANSYICPAGVPTIGYGTTRINDLPVPLGITITESEAELLLQEDLIKFETAINRLVTVELTQNQFDALVSFVYNVGEYNFKKSTLLRLINDGDFENASNQFIRWNKANKKVLDGLTRRRNAEKDLFLRD